MNAVITGATKGIGKAIAVKLAQMGYNLALCARTENDLAALKNELESTAVNIHYFAADLSIKEEVLSLFHHLESVFKTIDVLVNNAGTFIPGSLLEETDGAFENQLLLNLNSSYYLAKNIGKLMRKQRFGHIFNICSIASKEIMNNAGSYTVTKTALLSLNDVLRKELSSHNVKVTAILPGSTLTSSWEGTTISPEKFVQPEDIANILQAALQLSAGVNVDEIILTPLKF